MVRRRKYLLKLLFIGVVIFGYNLPRATAQVDPHFSQYYAYPMWLNPGLTGVIDGDYRVSANFKRQWASITNPFQTAALSFDTNLSEHFGVGVTIMNQTAGDGGWNYFNALAAASYHAILDKNKMNIISIGMQVGVVNRHFDKSKLRFGIQWNPITGYDPTIPLGEVFDRSTSSDFDASFGVIYYNRNPNHRINPFLGVSAYHLTEPEDPFYKDINGYLPMRLNIHGGLRIKVSRYLSLTPQLLYLQQGSDFGNGRAKEIVGSLYAQLFLNTQSDLLFGANYRNKDAVVPFVGLHIKSFTIGLSYDINTSDLNVASLNQGGMEISLSFTKKNKEKGPRFVCPRL